VRSENGRVLDLVEGLHGAVVVAEGPLDDFVLASTDHLNRQFHLALGQLRLLSCAHFFQEPKNIAWKRRNKLHEFFFAVESSPVLCELRLREPGEAGPAFERVKDDLLVAFVLVRA